MRLRRALERGLPGWRKRKTTTTQGRLFCRLVTLPFFLEKIQGVQLNLTPEIEVFYMLFDRSLSISRMTSLKQHMKYFHFRCYIQLGLPVLRVSGRAIHAIPHIYSTKFLHTFHMIKSQN